MYRLFWDGINMAKRAKKDDLAMLGRHFDSQIESLLNIIFLIHELQQPSSTENLAM